MLALLPSLQIDDRKSLIENYAYISPEYKTAGVLTEASDIYSLGIHFVRCLTGMLPYHNLSAAIRTETASTDYAAALLSDKNIPAELISIALRMLAPDPKKRYSSCTELIKDIRYFLDPAGDFFFPYGRFPSPPLSNDGRQSYSNQNDYTVRSLDRIAYFRSLETDYASNAAVKNHSESDKKTVPNRRKNEEKGLTVFSGEYDWSNSNSPTKEKPLPKVEIARTSSQVSIPAVDYIPVQPTPASSSPMPNEKRKVEQEREEKPPTVAPKIPVQPVTVPSTVQLSDEIPHNKLKEAAPNKKLGLTEQPEGILRNNAKEVFQENNDEKSPEPTVPQKSKNAKNTRSKTNQVPSSRPVLNRIIEEKKIAGANSRIWARHRVRPEDITRIITLTAKWARKGTGCFRFIQEPETKSVNISFFTSLEVLRDRFLYVTVGSCARFGTAGILDFVTMLQKGLSYSFNYLPSSTVRYLTRQLAKKDTFGVFSELYHPASPSLVKQKLTPPVIQSSEFCQSIANSLRVLGSGRRPLVLIIRGGERIQRELHELFLLIATETDTAPVCVFAFFDYIQFPSWHVLSALTGKKEE